MNTDSEHQPSKPKSKSESRSHNAARATPAWPRPIAVNGASGTSSSSYPSVEMTRQLLNIEGPSLGEAFRFRTCFVGPLMFEALLGQVV